MSYRWIHLCVVLLFTAGNVIGGVYNTTDYPNRMSDTYQWQTQDGQNPMGPPGNCNVSWSATKTLLGNGKYQVVISANITGTGQYLGNVTLYKVNSTTEAWAATLWQYEKSNSGTYGTVQYSYDLEEGFMLAVLINGWRQINPTQALSDHVQPPTLRSGIRPFAATNEVAYDLPANTSGNAIVWNVVYMDAQGQTVLVDIGERRVNAGEPAQRWVLQGIPATYNDPTRFRLRYWLPSLRLETGGMWVTVAAGQTPKAESIHDTDIELLPVNIIPSGDAITDTNTVAVTAPTVVPNAAVAPSGTGGTIWRSVSSGGGLSDATYMEGIDKVVNALAAGDRVAQGIENAAKGAPSAGQQSTAGSSAKGNAEDAASTGLPLAAAKVAAKNEPNWVFNLGLGGTVLNVDLDPFKAGRFGTVADWIKGAIAWWLGILFFRHVFSAGSESMEKVSQAQQAKGNPVIGGTGAQATAFTAATIMTAIIVAGIAAIAAVMSYDVGLGSVTGLWSENPYDGISGGAAYLLDRVFPTSTWVLYILAVPLIKPAMAKICVGVAAAVRFVVP